MAREHQLKTVGCADPAPQTLQRLVTRVRCAWTWERTVGVVLIIAGLILALPAAAQERRFTAEDLARAVVRAGEPVRAWGDDPAGFCRLVGSGAAGPERAWLSLSGGGEDGAFGAGVLVGWTRSSQRRDYDLVTGVSAGALMAPYAFLGRGFDDALRAMYAGSSAAEVFEVGYTGPDALLDTWPLARSIGLHVTPGLVALIAEEHRRGRRLLVVTTNLDAERPVVWSLGALAQGDPGKAAVLIQSVLLASASIPGLFPPVRVESRRPDGSSLIELHGDGSASAPFFLLPEPVLGGHGRKAQGAGSCPPGRADIVINGRLSPEFQPTSAQTIPLLGRGASTLVKAYIRLSLERARRWAAGAETDLSVTTIPADIEVRRRGPFDERYMKALYEAGERLGATRPMRTGPHVTGAAARR